MFIAKQLEWDHSLYCTTMFIVISDIKQTSIRACGLVV